MDVSNFLLQFNNFMQSCLSVYPMHIIVFRHQLIRSTWELHGEKCLKEVDYGTQYTYSLLSIPTAYLVYLQLTQYTQYPVVKLIVLQSSMFAHAHQYLNELDTVLSVSMHVIQKPSGTCSTLATLGILISAFGLLNPIDTSKTVSNYYLDHSKYWCRSVGSSLSSCT